MIPWKSFAGVATNMLINKRLKAIQKEQPQGEMTKYTDFKLKGHKLKLVFLVGRDCGKFLGYYHCSTKQTMILFKITTTSYVTGIYNCSAILV